MTKAHLIRNKMITTTEARAVCSTNPYVGGSRPNGRKTYQFMASDVVSWEEFQAVAPGNRCAHCVGAGLVIRNRQRVAKRLPPVKTLFEGCSKANGGHAVWKTS
tara:strand:+ start:413 stop:724 length:312 start_codon:yes stop_codon:yes gene_type:complete